MHEGPNERDPSASSDDVWLDEVLKETFPASDPIPWRHKDIDATRVEASSGTQSARSRNSTT